MLDISYLNALRRAEMEQVLPHLRPGCKVLEFGSGTGEQARFLAQHGFDVAAIDLASSNYAQHRVFPVQDYDGRRIPLPDRSIDVIFSSNVLEHVENFDEIAAEFRRVLKPDGYAVHVLPTPTWRFWSFVTGVAESLRAAGELPVHQVRVPLDESRWRVLWRDLRRVASGFVPRAHGTSREGISELWTFSRTAWRRKLQRAGFEVVSDRPMGLFYTGSSFLGRKFALSSRERLSRVLGSATHLYLLKPANGRRD